MSTQSIHGRRSRVALVAIALLIAGLLPPAGASATPDPTSVTVAGSLQSEIGCAADWDPACAATHLTYDASDDVWQGTFSIPAGNYDYKAALNDSWNENYGLHAESGGANIPLGLGSDANVKFYYDHKSHWITDNHSSIIAVAPGSFQSELGCPGDWDPGLPPLLAPRSRRGRHLYLLDHGAARRAHTRRRWLSTRIGTENYGEGGVLNGSNIAFTVPADNPLVTFSYDSVSHVLSITVAATTGAPGAPGALSHFDLARKDCLGTARNTTSKVWYTVANGVLSDVYYPTVDNTNVETLQYIVTDGATFTDVQTRDMTYDGRGRRRHRRDGLSGHRDGQERQVQDRHGLHHRPGPEHGPDEVAFVPEAKPGDPC